MPVFSEQPLPGPKAYANCGLVLTHGAGGNANSPLLVTIAGWFAQQGVRVVRYDLPFRQRRKFGPPFPAAATQDREGLKQQVAQMREIVSGPVYLGGHSYGGRQASMLAAEQPGLVDGLLLLSYPLHPPKKPADLRTGHFQGLQTPALFLHGTKDPFGSPEEMRGALDLIRSKKTLELVEGAGHDLAKGKFPLGLLARLLS